MLHAVDAALIKRNGAEIDTAEAQIIGDDINFPEAATIRITSKYPMEIKAAALIRKKLRLSRSAFENMCELGKIVCTSGQNLKKCKMNGEIIFQINP